MTLPSTAPRLASSEKVVSYWQSDKLLYVSTKIRKSNSQEKIQEIRELLIRTAKEAVHQKHQSLRKWSFKSSSYTYTNKDSLLVVVRATLKPSDPYPKGIETTPSSPLKIPSLAEILLSQRKNTPVKSPGN